MISTSSFITFVSLSLNLLAVEIVVHVFLKLMKLIVEAVCSTVCVCSLVKLVPFSVDASVPCT